MTIPVWAWIATAVVAALFVAAALCAAPLSASARRRRLQAARREFADQRERLEAEFFNKAASSGRPRGLRWTKCEFDDGPSIARNRKSNELAAFVGVTVSFEAVEGGGMEDVEAVGNLRAASAVFHFGRSGWTTDGRVLFNLEPDEAIEYFKNELEPVSDP